MGLQALSAIGGRRIEHKSDRQRAEVNVCCCMLSVCYIWFVYLPLFYDRRKTPFSNIIIAASS